RPLNTRGAVIRRGDIGLRIHPSRWLNRTFAKCRPMDGPGRCAPLYSVRVLCPEQRRAQTYALSLNDDHGDAAEAGSAGPPRSGKPEGLQASPLEPRVQGRLARIAMAEDVPITRGPCRPGIGPFFCA